MNDFQTEFEFTLPKGYLDKDGNLHREGRMRLATAADEILPLKDPFVQANPAYLVIILLSRVLTSLGTVSLVTPKVIENLYVEDLAYLQDFYNRINGSGANVISVVCPHCKETLEVVPEHLGGSSATPSQASTRR